MNRTVSIALFAAICVGAAYGQTPQKQPAPTKPAPEVQTVEPPSSEEIAKAASAKLNEERELARIERETRSVEANKAMAKAAERQAAAAEGQAWASWLSFAGLVAGIAIAFLTWLAAHTANRQGLRAYVSMKNYKITFDNARNRYTATFEIWNSGASPASRVEVLATLAVVTDKKHIDALIPVPTNDPLLAINPGSPVTYDLPLDVQGPDLTDIQAGTKWVGGKLLIKYRDIFSKPCWSKGGMVADLDGAGGYWLHAWGDEETC